MPLAKVQCGSFKLTHATTFARLNCFNRNRFCNVPMVSLRRDVSAGVYEDHGLLDCVMCEGCLPVIAPRSAGTPYGTCHKAYGRNRCQSHKGIRGCCLAHCARGVGANLLRFTGELAHLSRQLRRRVADQRAGCALNLASYFLDRTFCLFRFHSMLR